MTTQDMDILARKIVSLERRHNALARAQQLPNSSVRLVDGDDVGLAESAEATKDIGDEAAYLGDWLTDADNNLDDNAEYGVEVPEWIQDAGHAGDVAWDSTQFATDLALTLDTELSQAKQELEQAQLDITAATSAANQAANKALQASLDAAAADSKAQSALDTLQTTVTSSVIEYAVGDSDTVAPTTGWSTDNPEPGEGEFVWMRTVVTYADESTATSSPVLMSRGGGGGGESVKIDSIAGFYAMVALDPFPPVMPDLPTTITPSSPWVQYVPTYAEGFLLVKTDRIIYTDESFAYTGLANVPGWAEAGQAQAEAEAARFLAEGLFQVIPSETAPTTSPTGALKQGDQWWKIGTGETDGRFVGVAVWDGSAWQDRQLVADSILVPSSVGTTLIADNAITTGKIMAGAVTSDKIVANAITADKIAADAITADKIAATAIDGMTIRGALVQGGVVEQVGESKMVGTYAHPLYADEILEFGWENIFDYLERSSAPSVPTSYQSSHVMYAKVGGDGPNPRVGWRVPADYVGSRIQLRFQVRTATTQTIRVTATGAWVSVPANTWQTVTSPEFDVPSQGIASVYSASARFYCTEPEVIVVSSQESTVRLHQSEDGPALSFYLGAALTGRYTAGRALVAGVDGTNIRQTEIHPNGIRFGNRAIAGGPPSTVYQDRVESPGQLGLIGRRSIWAEADEFLQFKTLQSLLSIQPDNIHLIADNILYLKANGQLQQFSDAAMFFTAPTATFDCTALFQKSLTAQGNVTAPNLPSRIRSGSVSSRNVAAGGVNNVTVTFPSGFFPGTPHMVASVYGDARDTTVSVDNVSATSATVRLGSMSTVTRNIGARWIAMRN